MRYRIEPNNQKQDELAEPPTFGRFLWKFRGHWFTAMSGGLSVPLTFAAIYFQNAPLRVLLGLLAVTCLLQACYQVWRDSVSELQVKIAGLDSDIEILKHRDYDEEHKRLAQQKLGQLREISLDLICLLLHHGKIEQEDLRKHCQHDPEFNEAIQRARELDLIRNSMEPIPGRAGLQYFWKVNPAFEIVLQDVLGKRRAVFFR